MLLAKKKCETVFSSSDVKILQSIDSAEVYAYGTSKDPVGEKEDIKCNNTIK